MDLKTVNIRLSYQNLKYPGVIITMKQLTYSFYCRREIYKMSRNTVTTHRRVMDKKLSNIRTQLISVGPSLI